MTMTITGLDNLKQYLANLQEKVLQESADIIHEEAIAIMNDSLQEVPVLTGALASTADVDSPEITDTSVIVDMGYGNQQVNYALIQHEGGTTPTGGQIEPKKYLERPALAHAAEFESEVGPKIGSAIERIS